jgi:hypothetical protein
MRQTVTKHKKKLTVLVIVIAALLAWVFIWYPYQKGSATSYLKTKLSCFQETYYGSVSASETSYCAETRTVTLSPYLLGLGMHYFYQPGHARPSYTCGLGKPPTYTGNIISMFGRHFIFNQAYTEASSAGGAC